MKLWLTWISVIVLLSGCGFNNETGEKSKNEQQTINVKNTTIQDVDRQAGQQISRNLVKIATGVPEVNDATAVVLGRYAMVGIDVDEDLERSEVGAIKYTVAESLKNDPHGARAVVIADPDFTGRLKEIQEDIQKGKPVQGIFNELADISGRLMPEVPADIVDPNENKKGTEEQKDNLNSKERKKLEKQQDEQSKHQKD